MKGLLRIHYTFNEDGGAEYDIRKSMEVMFRYLKTKKHLVIIARDTSGYVIGDHNWNRRERCTIGAVQAYLTAYVMKEDIDIINIHGMPYPEVTECILNLGLPVVRTLHESMLTCPGWARFLRTSASPCQRNFGLMCIANAFAERCQQSRMPSNIVAAYVNVHREQRSFVPRYRRLLVYSDYMAGILKQHGIDLQRVVKIPSPQIIDVERIDRKAKVGTPRLIFAGRITKEKGIHLLLAAYRRISERLGTQIHMDIIGKGELLAEMQALASSCSFNKVRFHGWLPREQIWEMFASDSIVIVPSIYPDNLPNVVAEAMMCGAPVVASNAGGTSEWFIDKESGMTYSSGDVEELTLNILRLIRDANLRREIGDGGRLQIQKHHSPRTAAAAYELVYRDALVGKD